MELVELFCKKLKANHPAACQLVLDQEVRSTQFDSTKQEQQLKTALIIAAEKNNHEIVRILIEMGADFHKKVNGLTPLDYAPISPFRRESHQLLWQAWYGNVLRPLSSLEKLNALYVCCSQGEFNSAQRLIENKIFPFDDTRSPAGEGLLLIVMKSISSWEQKRILMTLLLNKGEDINQADSYGVTALILAASQDLETMQLLLNSPGINVEHQDKRKNTALHYAATGNRPKTVETLLANRANPNIQNEEGKTPLHFTKDVKIVETLVLKGANPLMQDKLGNTPRDYAQLEKDELSKFLAKCENWYHKK